MTATYANIGPFLGNGSVNTFSSADLNPCDFFLELFEGKILDNIRREIANIPAEQLQKVNQNHFHRCDECLRVEGQNFQHL
jgi:hypothetical protein